MASDKMELRATFHRDKVNWSIKLIAHLSCAEVAEWNVYCRLSKALSAAEIGYVHMRSLHDHDWDIM
jgi:hypothetical protein